MKRNAIIMVCLAFLCSCRTPVQPTDNQEGEHQARRTAQEKQLEEAVLRLEKVDRSPFLLGLEESLDEATLKRELLYWCGGLSPLRPYDDAPEYLKSDRIKKSIGRYKVPQERMTEILEELIHTGTSILENEKANDRIRYLANMQVEGAIIMLEEYPGPNSLALLKQYALSKNEPLRHQEPLRHSALLSYITLADAESVPVIRESIEAMGMPNTIVRYRIYRKLSEAVERLKEGNQGVALEKINAFLLDMLPEANWYLFGKLDSILCKSLDDYAYSFQREWSLRLYPRLTQDGGSHHDIQTEFNNVPLEKRTYLCRQIATNALSREIATTITTLQPPFDDEIVNEMVRWIYFVNTWQRSNFDRMQWERSETIGDIQKFGISQEQIAKALEGIIRERLPMIDEIYSNEGESYPAYEKARGLIQHPMKMLLEFNRADTLALLKECTLSKSRYVQSEAIQTYLNIAGGDSAPFLQGLLGEGGMEISRLCEVLRPQINQFKGKGRVADAEKLNIFLLNRVLATQDANEARHLDALLCATLDGYATSVQRKQVTQMFLLAKDSQVSHYFFKVKVDINNASIDDYIDLGKKLSLAGPPPEPMYLYQVRMGLGYEWREKDDEHLANEFAPRAMILSCGMSRPKPPLIRQFIEKHCPGITDSAMAGHLVRNIDRLLVEGRGGEASRLLGSLTVLDNPDAVKQLEHYFAVASSEGFRERMQSAARSPDVVAQELNGLQAMALASLLPRLDITQRMECAGNVITNNFYAPEVRCSRAVLESVHLGLVLIVFEQEESIYGMEALDSFLNSTRPYHWFTHPRRKAVYEKWVEREDIPQDKRDRYKNYTLRPIYDALRPYESNYQPAHIVEQINQQQEAKRNEAKKLHDELDAEIQRFYKWQESGIMVSPKNENPPHDTKRAGDYIVWEWSTHDDELLVIMLSSHSSGHATSQEIRRAEKGIQTPRIRLFMQQHRPYATDAEMVEHLSCNIDRLLDDGDIPSAISLLSSLRILDTPQATRHLERYLSMTFDNELRDKVSKHLRRLYWHFASPAVTIERFQAEILRNLLLAFDPKKRMKFAENIMRNNQYAILARDGVFLAFKSLYEEETNPAMQERYRDFLRKAEGWEDALRNVNQIDDFLVQVDHSWAYSQERKAILDKWLARHITQEARNTLQAKASDIR